MSKVKHLIFVVASILIVSGMWLPFLRYRWVEEKPHGKSGFGKIVTWGLWGGIINVLAIVGIIWWMLR